MSAVTTGFPRIASVATSIFTNIAQVSENERRYRSLVASINDALIERGRLVAVNYVMQRGVDELHDVCGRIAIASTPAERDRLHSEANALMTEYCFAPPYRAFMVHRAQQLPYLRQVAHVLEAATINYYRQDYLAATLLLAPAVENLMNRHVGYDISERQVDSVALRLKIGAKRSTASERRFSERHPLMLWYVMRFLNERYYEKTVEARFNESFFHRHYMLHGLGNEPFYTFADCQTLFQYFDMYLEMIASETDDNILSANIWGAVSTDEGAIPQRTALYWRLVVSHFLYGPSDEEILLRLHPSYAPEAGDTNYISVGKTTALSTLMTGVMSLLNSGGEKKSLRGLPIESDRVMIPARRKMLTQCIETLAALGLLD